MVERPRIVTARRPRGRFGDMPNMTPENTGSEAMPQRRCSENWRAGHENDASTAATLAQHITSRPAGAVEACQISYGDGPLAIAAGCQAIHDKAAQ